ncbi:MAG TPA: hypothetical protein VFE54_14775, partial [Mucilaginibacter sp.]|nr:hypothetical protein [Mucilaginibacter sp.]
MKEFMLLIRNTIDSKTTFSAEQDLAFLKACEVYIEGLNKGEHLKKAQPLIREGVMVSNPNGKWQEGAFSEGNE